MRSGGFGSLHRLSDPELDDEGVVPQLQSRRCRVVVGPFCLYGCSRSADDTIVYTGHHRLLGSHVIAQEIDESENSARLLRAVKCAWLLREHPNIQTPLWVSHVSATQSTFVFNEYPNDSIGSLLQRVGKVTEKRAKSIVAQLASAVSYMHNNAIVHQSLSLDTVQLRHDRIKITGFEYVNDFDDTHRRHAIHHRLPYCTPELMAGEDVTMLDMTKADIWAVGIITYTLLIGSEPFMSDEQKIRDVLVSVPAWISPPCSELITCTLRRNPSARPSAHQIRRMTWLREISSPMHPLFETDSSKIDERLRELGASDAYLEASKIQSLSSLPAAERRLLQAKMSFEATPRFKVDDDVLQHDYSSDEPIHQVPTLDVTQACSDKEDISITHKKLRSRPIDAVVPTLM